MADENLEQAWERGIPVRDRVLLDALLSYDGGDPTNLLSRAYNRIEQLEALVDRLVSRVTAVKRDEQEGVSPATSSEFARVHAGAETTRRVIVGALEGHDRFRDPVVVAFLRDVLDALDGGSRKQGLLALGDTPDERIARGRAAVQKERP